MFASDYFSNILANTTANRSLYFLGYNRVATPNSVNFKTLTRLPFRTIAQKNFVKQINMDNKKFEERSWLPRITFSDAVTTPLEISNHSVHVQVVLPLVKVTSTLEFVNNHNKTLQGELVLPLPDDATVVGYALDTNGILIDAVPIEKEKAKVVFEEEVRTRGKGVAVVE